jgi:hypothetical protein
MLSIVKTLKRYVQPIVLLLKNWSFNKIIMLLEHNLLSKKFLALSINTSKGVVKKYLKTKKKLAKRKV